MQKTVVEKIRSVIMHCKFGAVFFVSSFPEYVVVYVTKRLPVFALEGLISSIS